YYKLEGTILGISAMSSAGASLRIMRNGLPVGTSGGAGVAAAAGAGAKTPILLALRPGTQQDLVFDTAVQEASIVSVRGRVWTRMTSAGGSLVIPVQTPGQSRLGIESGVWIIQMKT